MGELSFSKLGAGDVCSPPDIRHQLAYKHDINNYRVCQDDVPWMIISSSTSVWPVKTQLTCAQSRER